MGAPGSSPSDSPRVVAAVDDDRRIRASMQSVLESAGFEAETFASAEAFLDTDVMHRAGCVVADVRLPGIDGFELHRRLRAARPTLPVIFVTAYDDDEARRRALRDGALAFMGKPFDAAELLAYVGAALAR
nr:response regulator [Luteitalea sp. TBR-22]